METPMDAADLRLFATVARTGGIGKAALELNTVQSNVTSRLKTLEDRLGTLLFERSHRGVELTAAGQRLLPYAERVGRLLEDAKRAVLDEGQPAGPLTIGTLETTAALRLSPLLARFVKSYPAVDLSLKTGTSCELVAQVLDRALDGAFVCGPVDHPELRAETMFCEELAVLTAPDVSDVDERLRAGDFKMIVLRAGCSYRLIFEAYLARRGIVGERVLEFGTLEAIVSCVAAGLGVTLLPKALINAVRDGDRVAVHHLPQGEGRVETVFIQHRDAYATSALRAFLDVVRPALIDRDASTKPRAEGAIALSDVPHLIKPLSECRTEA
jgi:LysR family transcriptional regulator, cell division regulator